MPRRFTGERVRLNLEVPVALRERIERLQVLSEADTMTEVIRRALITYEAFLSHEGEILLVKPDGSRVKVILT